MKSSKWLKKSLVIIVSILTFGLVSPSELPWLNDSSPDKSPKKNALEGLESYSYLSSRAEEDRGRFIHEMTAKAEETAYMKFGPRIKPKIEDEFKAVILPKIETAIAEMADTYPTEDWENLAVTETPAAGLGERIFHIYEASTGKDALRFHVRRENPPQEGYWFNFHYHTSEDSFTAHHDLGRIYWDKNTPPKWEGSSVKQV